MVNRPVPHDNDAEAACLGAAMTHPEATRTVLDSLVAEDFHDPAHSAIFTAIKRCHLVGTAIDPVTVAATLDMAGALERIGGRQRLLAIQAETPLSSSATSYVTIVAERATARRAISTGERLVDLGYEMDVEGALDLARGAERELGAPLALPELHDLDDLAAYADTDDEDPTKPWVIPALLRARDTLVITGSEGYGKSTLLRQMAVTTACGLHAFTGLAAGVDGPLRVLCVDLQEDHTDLAAEMRKLRHKAGTTYTPGFLKAVARPQGMNLLAPRDARWFEAMLDQHRPSLVTMGPLVRMFRSDARSRYDEDLVDELTDTLDTLRTRYGFALAIEGHAGNDRGSDEAWRPRGSSVWRSWPRFGLGLESVELSPQRVMRVHHWRGAGYAGRPWPRQLISGAGWPWKPDDKSYEAICRALGQGWLIDGGTQDELLDEAL